MTQLVWCHPELVWCHPELVWCHPELVSGSLKLSIILRSKDEEKIQVLRLYSDKRI